MVSQRLNICINQTAYKILKKASKFSNKSFGKIIGELIIQKLGDPIQSLIDQKRELAKQMSFIDSEVKRLEELAGGQTDG